MIAQLPIITSMATPFPSPTPSRSVGPGKVDESHPLTPAGPSPVGAGPGPATGDRIDQPGEDRRDHDVAEIADPLGDGAGHDRRGGAAEHELEQEEGSRPPGVAAPQVGGGAEHQRAADSPEHRTSHAAVHKVLGGTVYRVSRSHDPGLESADTPSTTYK